MKSTDITKIRQLLRTAQKAFWTNEGWTYSHAPTSEVLPLIDEALALLPCETCNGTKRKIIFQPGQREFGGDASTSYEIPCPGCP